MSSQAKPFLMGSETEYAVAGREATGQIHADDLYRMLAEVLRRERAWMADRDDFPGQYLQHGGRLYLDSGWHPEHATPECFTPRQVACYDKAGEALLDLARRRLLEEGRATRVSIVKNNLDSVYPGECTYGTHESYTCWARNGETASQLLPHLASRIVYAGSGCLSADPHGIGFELSQRARHIVQSVGHNTTAERALFSTRLRKVSDYSNEGWFRIHLISKDSQRAPFGIYLTFAATGLLVEMLNRGLRIGQGVHLANPVQALRDFSRDPWLRVRAPLSDGRQFTALEIQESYLAECERAVQHGEMPDWAPEAVWYWRQTIEGLARDPLSLANRLDPYCKLLIYQHELLRGGFDWNDLREALAKLALLRAAYSEPAFRAVLVESATGLSAEATSEYDQARAALGVGQPKELERLRFAVRLQALDIQYHELGGLYDRLREAGRMEDVILDSVDVERATREPPAGGRAAARGAFIRSVAGEEDWLADWQYLWHEPTGRCLDLRDPFRGAGTLVHLPVPPDAEDDDGPADVLELLTQRVTV
ncbi:MAG TPA: proteasome accessory factor PafA2 family protein [Gemmataceae bacterium]|jgi:hypothetical protein